MAHLFVEAADTDGTGASLGSFEPSEPLSETSAADAVALSVPWGVEPAAPRLRFDVVELGSDGVTLAGSGATPLHVVEAERAVDAPLAVVSSRDEDGRQRWLALAEPDVGLRLNGGPVLLGARVLSHRDELRLAGIAGRVFFSLEELCRVAPFEGPEGALCPRCRAPIETGSPAVGCPQCNTFYHESEARPCWTYAPRCALDDQSTALHAGYGFRPEEVYGD